MKREETAAQRRNPDARVLKFVSRAEQLGVRGMRNYNRYMLVNKGFVPADGPERRQWQKESVEESVRDAAWNRHHGPVPGGATVYLWCGTRDAERLEQTVTSTAAIIR